MPLQTTQITQSAIQQSTPPAPQEAQEEEAILEGNAEITAEKQEQKPLYQATVDDVTESTVEKETQQQRDGNSMLNSKSTRSEIPRLCTTPASRDQAACLSNTLLSAYQHALNLACQHTIFQAWHGPLLGYIRCMEGMEATGQG